MQLTDDPLLDLLMAIEKYAVVPEAARQYEKPLVNDKYNYKPV